MIDIVMMTGTGVLLGLAIGLVVRYFGVPEDPLVESLNELMPGANCGGCGLAGCSDYANAMATGRAKPGLCPVMSAEDVAKCCELLGVESDTSEPKIAVVCCSGDDNHAAKQAFYNGVNDCLNAMLVAGGAKGCTYGCLGLGSCARACPFGAIEMLPNHLAKIHADLCTGCGKCYMACPRNVIKLVPRSAAKVHVYCNSPEKAPVKKKVCKAACIGCRKCARTAEEGQIVMNGFLASINYDNPPAEDIVETCPTKCLRKAE